MNKYRHSLPAPVHEGGTGIWRLAQVLSWRQDKGRCAPLPAGLVAMLR